MPTDIKIIIGLGNPGEKYHPHRHNVGVWFIDNCCASQKANLKLSSKLKTRYTKIPDWHDLILAVPNVFMNNSGGAVHTILNFFKFSPENAIIVHDDLDLEPGVCKLKFAGGHGGHNGVRDIIENFGHGNFWRLRIGIGHPGHKSEVHNYVLSAPKKSEHELIVNSLWRAEKEMPNIIDNNLEQAIQNLHTGN